MLEPEDEILLKEFKVESTRSRAFEQILKKYQRRVYWHIRKMVIDHDDADDVTQNTFIKVWGGLDNFREDSKLFTWMYRIATNEALTFINKKKANLYTDWDTVEYSLAETITHDPYFNGDNIQMKLQQAILTLPDKQRLVFNMKYFENMKYEQMSEITGTSVGALKASYHHAVKKVEKFFGIG
ncbi:MAG: sigma-70 family RNA polymerase sigma factor [Flavobacteriaceae bacterium]|nr:sigma-70 family RNA polymerase sigma factor [Flavobacteriaceae bacterium]